MKASAPKVLSFTLAYSKGSPFLSMFNSSMNSPASSKYTVSVKNSVSLKLYTNRRKIPPIKAVTIPIPADVKVAAICKPPCLYGVLRRALNTGSSFAVIGYASVADEQANDAATMALTNPPIRPGMACRLWTPQVSYRPILFSRQGVRYWNPRVDTMPVKNPMASDPAGWKMMPAVAPMTTPPAKEALSICSIVNFSFTRALVMKVDKQLPVSERMVLPMICVLVKGVGEKTPKLKEGQYIHRKREPIIAKRLEKQLLPAFDAGFAIAVRMRLDTMPEYAPNVWMVILPPTSKALIQSQHITQFRVYPTQCTKLMMRHSNGPTRPMTTPRLMNMDAAEQRADVKDSQSMQMQQLVLLKPVMITLFQNALSSMQIWTITAFMKKVQETADHENDLEKAIKNPKPTNIITLTSWYAGYLSALRETSVVFLKRTKTPQSTMMTIQVMASRMTKPFRLRVWCQAPPFIRWYKAINYKQRDKIVIERGEGKWDWRWAGEQEDQKWRSCRCIMIVFYFILWAIGKSFPECQLQSPIKYFLITNKRMPYDVIWGISLKKMCKMDGLLLWIYFSFLVFFILLMWSNIHQLQRYIILYK